MELLSRCSGEVIGRGNRVLLEGAYVLTTDTTIITIIIKPGTTRVVGEIFARICLGTCCVGWWEAICWVGRGGSGCYGC